MNFFLIYIVLLLIASYFTFKSKEEMSGIYGPVHLISNENLMHLKYAGN